MSNERRGSDRAPIELKVEYRRLNTFFADYTKNISKGGTFIGTDKPLAIGTMFVFALTIPKIDEPMRLNGEVVWTVATEDASEERPAGMGIRFHYQSDEQRLAMEAIVEQLMRSQLGEYLSDKLLGRSGAE
jgi:type IV pilus assembly protein PilZ